MDLIDRIRQLSQRIAKMKSAVLTEEATKMSFIVPFFQMLGYDVFNPEEFLPAFTADVGIKKGEKVDYAIMIDDQPVILIECKWCGLSLTSHDSQLFRYFGTTTAKFGILTNGIIYKFYTDLDAPNKMDLKPFFEFDITDIKEAQVAELKKFQKSSFNLEEVINTASELRYSSAFKKIFSEQLQNPNDDFVRLFLTDVYDGVKTIGVIERFRPVLKKALNQFISETMNDKIKSALDTNDAQPPQPQEVVEEPVNDVQEPISKIITTEEEIQAHALICGMLKDVVKPEDIVHKDTESYFGILYQNNTRKWICRLRINNSRVVLNYPDANKNVVKVDLTSIFDLLNYKEQLIEVAKRYID